MSASFVQKNKDACYRFGQGTVQLAVPVNNSAYALLTVQQARDDLAQLTEFIQTRSSYALSVAFPYRAVIAEIQSRIDSPVQVEQIAITTQRVLQEIGDAHGRINHIERYIPQVYSPIGFGRVGRQCFAYYFSDNTLLDDACPYVRRIDGEPISRWLACAESLSAGTYGSESSKTLRSFLFMRYVALLRNEMGIAHKDTVTIELSDALDRKTTNLCIPLVTTLPTPKAPLNLTTQSRMLDKNIGYLRIHSQHDDTLPALIHQHMQQFKTSQALIIDARQCGGGVRDNLLALFPYFIPADAPPYIANVCKLRIPLGQEDSFDPIGKLDTWDKSVPYRNDPKVPLVDRQALESFLQTFQPVWNVPEEAFSDWYFMALGNTPKHYYYDKPVYLMVDWGVGSAGDIFSSCFKNWPNINIVGMPTNGRSGNAIEFALTHSKVSFILSTMVSFQKDGQLYEGAGVSPDYHFAHTLQDWLGQTDSQLDRTLHLIHQHLAER